MNGRNYFNVFVSHAAAEAKAAVQIRPRLADSRMSDFTTPGSNRRGKLYPQIGFAPHGSDPDVPIFTGPLRALIKH